MQRLDKPNLFIFVKQATHFLQWERKEFEKFFHLCDEPSSEAILLSFGPDALEGASQLPAKKRFAVLFPGFGHNPVYNPEIKKLHKKLITQYFDTVFINPGPLEIAYKGLSNVEFYPFSIDTSLVKMQSPRTQLKSLIHVSSEYPQKDWERSKQIMEKTGLDYDVFPPRNHGVYQ